MSRTKLTMVLVLPFALGGALGAWATYAFFIRDAMAGMTALGDLSVAALYETRINLFGDAGTDEEYEAALNEYIVVLDRLRAKHPNSEDRVSLALSKITTLGRLALVAEKRGASTEAERLFNAAMSECQSAKWRDCSIEKMRELALYFENRRTRHVTAAPK